MAVNPLAVYVHIPFCTIKCGYCDFNVYAGMNRLKPAYTEAIVAEVRNWKEMLSSSSIVSVFFGGGTPSEMDPSSIAAILDAIKGTSGGMASDAEVTIETNPGTTSATGMSELRRAGVNRLSLGVQSFDSDELAFLDRIHSPEAAEASLRMARDAGFENISIDLIYGLPDQTAADWSRTLERALTHNPEHLSIYALTVEEGTALDRRVERGAVVPADGDLVAEMYELATERLRSSALGQYELSNWAKQGFESRHNRTYWTDGDYLGLGAGAHGYVQGERYENEPHPRVFIERLSEPAGPANGAVVGRYRPDRVTAISDWLGLRLRLTDGFRCSEFETKFGENMDESIGPPIVRAVEAGALARKDGNLRLTNRGRMMHSEVVVNVMAYLNDGHAAELPRSLRVD